SGPERRKGRKKKRDTSEDEDFDFKRPGDIKEETFYGEQFMSGSMQKKKGEYCPICGTGMSYKEKVDAYYCPKCKNFF
ncbi:MAG: hypothetical protein R6V01_00005, partial [Thermoplasmatota archaeon]